MIGFYNYTVILTYLSLCSGALGIALSICNHTTLAMYCLMFSGLCDGFDGTIARTRKQSTEEEKNFGVQLDSLCDMVCFSVLPASIAFVTLRQYSAFCSNRRIYLVFIPVMCCYMLASLIRLAYFNVLAETSKPKPGERRFYMGLPVTAVSLIFPPIYMMRYVISPTNTVMIPIIIIFFVLISIAYVIKIKIPKPTLKQIFIMIAVGAVELIIFVLLKCRSIKI